MYEQLGQVYTPNLTGGMVFDIQTIDETALDCQNNRLYSCSLTLFVTSWVNCSRWASVKSS